MSLASDTAARPDAERPARSTDNYTIPMPDFAPGTVWLAGAGPGDAGLITLQVEHALREADIIYYDALVNGDILRLARPDAERVFVGKRAGIASPRQGDITRRLVESARAGARVLRLKGGDPFVFGRGAEEALALAEACVPFRVLPGITAGIGGLAYAGLAVTHRDYNQAVAFVTAHDAAGALAEGLDWAALFRAAPVIVVYMGFRLMGEIRAALLAAGAPADHPVAIVSRATTEAQASLVTTLGGMVEAVASSSAIEPPAMLVFGEIVRLRPGLDWREPGESPAAEAAARSA